MMRPTTEMIVHEKPIEEFTAEVVRSCLDAKGQAIAVLDVSDIFGLADHFIVVSGRSDRHVQGIVNRVIETVGRDPDAIEGYETGHWVILDFSDVVVHVMYGPTRELYDLESLWAQARRLSVHRDNGSGEIALRAA